MVPLMVSLSNHRGGDPSTSSEPALRVGGVVGGNNIALDAHIGYSR